MDPFLAQISIFGGTFAPRNWAFCYGQLLSIAEYQAAFSLVGTYYGGDGRTSMGLPDLRGRAAVGVGSGPGLTPYGIGQFNGFERHTLSVSELPAHHHTATFISTGFSGGAVATMHAADGTGSTNTPDGNYLATVPKAGLSDVNAYGATKSSTETLAADAISVNLQGDVTGAVTVDNTGLGNSFNIVQPVQALHYIFAIEGVYPSRN